MAVNEVLQSLGSWDLQLKATTPDYVVSQLNFFGHVAVVDGLVPDVASAGDSILAGARFVGVCREVDRAAQFTRSGAGLVYWLGDEDGKGVNFESQVTLTNATLAQVVAALKPPTVTTGTVFAQVDSAARYTGTHIFQSPREALAIALAPFGAEVRVNPNFTIDVGTPAQLYNTAAPDTIIKRRAAGADVDMAAIGGAFDVAGSAVDYSTRIVLLGQTIGTGGAPDTVFATGSVSAPSVPWKDPQGNAVKLTRFISESGQTTGSVAARAQLQLNRFNRATQSVKVTADQFEVQGSFSTGDATYVYDPDTGIVNAGIEVLFRGEKLNPDIVRVTGRTWPIVEGMTVAWRTDAGVWLDLTPWVVWETAGSHELTVGDLPKTLFTSGAPNGAVQDRLDGTRGTPDSVRVPKTPTGLVLSTASSPNAQGWDAAVITATWSPVTQYTDSTSVALSHYELQYRPQFRSPLWTASFVTDASPADLPVTAALGYDLQVRAVSTGGVASAWSSTVSIVSAADSTGPATPSDPVVTSYLGLLRIYWNGLSSVGGAMPSDFNRVDVHVGTSSGFTASAATLVSSLSAPGYAHAQAPYGSTRWVRFIAYDHNGNPSASSAVISGATVQAADGDIAALSVGKLTAGVMTADVTISGRFATALTGARREVNAVGFQAYDASNNLLVNIDGVNNLLTGIFQTALSGSRRIVIGAAGAAGEIDFNAPDGTLAYLRAYTESTGVEAMQMGIPKTGGDSFWNKIHFNTDEWMNLHANKLDFMYLNGGFFIVRQISARSGGTNVSRLQIDNNGTLIRDQANVTRVQVNSGGDLYHYGDATDQFQKWLGDGSFYMSYGVSKGDTEFWGTANPDLSGRMRMFTGTGYGLILRVNATSIGSGQPIRMECLYFDESSYQGFRASAYEVSSDAAGKEDIVDATEDFLGIAMGARLRSYSRKRGGNRTGDKTGKAYPREVGLVAQEAPALIRGGGDIAPSVDLYQMSTMTLGALQQAVRKLSDMEGRLTALERRAA